MFRKRNRILRRLVLGFAVAALVVPSAAMARVDEGGVGQPNSIGELKVSGNGFVAGVTDFPSNVQVKAGDYGMPRAMPSDYALQRGDAIEIARTHERNAVRPDDLIENVRLQPRTVSTPQVVSTGFDWGDAGIGFGAAVGLAFIGLGVALGMRRHGKSAMRVRHMPA